MVFTVLVILCSTSVNLLFKVSLLSTIQQYYFKWTLEKGTIIHPLQCRCLCSPEAYGKYCTMGMSYMDQQPITACSLVQGLSEVFLLNHHSRTGIQPRCWRKLCVYHIAYKWFIQTLPHPPCTTGRGRASLCHQCSSDSSHNAPFAQCLGGARRKCHFLCLKDDRLELPMLVLQQPLHSYVPLFQAEGPYTSQQSQK